MKALLARLKPLLLELRVIAIGIAIALVFRSFFYQPFNIPSGSMYPTLMVGDYLLAGKLSYGISRYSLPFSPDLFDGRIAGSAPRRGDVVIFRNPWKRDIDYIKRVIGLPGDRVRVEKGRLWINGSLIPRERIADYPYRHRGGMVTDVPQYIETLPGGTSYQILEMAGDQGPLDNTRTYSVPDDHYFMMGDNRDNSVDSRVIQSVGFVKSDLLVGQAKVLFYSVDETVTWWNPLTWFGGLRTNRLFTGIH